MRDSSKGSRRSLWPTVRHQELENLHQFRNLQISGEGLLLFQLVSPCNARHNCSDLPEVLETELSSSPDRELEPSPTGHLDWLSTSQFHSPIPELANTQPLGSVEPSTTQTVSASPDQENVPDKVNLSDFIPRAYIHSILQRWLGDMHLTFQFSSPLSPLSPLTPSPILSSSSPTSLPSDSTTPSLAYLFNLTGLSHWHTLFLQDRSLQPVSPASTLTSSPTSTLSTPTSSSSLLH